MEAQQHAVEFALAQFADLEQYRHPEGGGPALPLSDGLHDPVVAVRGAYPEVLVEVAFQHPVPPQGRLRRIHDVYDTAGRIRVDPHLAVRLMEDLDTGALPAPETAVDGVLTI